MSYSSANLPNGQSQPTQGDSRLRYRVIGHDDQDPGGDYPLLQRLNGEQESSTAASSSSISEESPNEEALRQQLVEVAHRTYRLGLVAATDGNVSARLPGGQMMISPSGSCLGELTVEDLVIVDAQDRVVKAAADRKPSSERKMHVAVYNARPDVDAILHAHPPTAIGFSVAGETLAGCVLPEVIVGLGTIPTLAYTTPTTQETADAVGAMIPHRDAIMLDRHGSVTVGKTIIEAFRKLEKLEHAAHITLIAKQLGRVRQLPTDEVPKAPLKAKSSSPSWSISAATTIMAL